MAIQTRQYKICLLIFCAVLLSRLFVLLFIVGYGDPGVLIRADEQRYFSVGLKYMNNVYQWQGFHWDAPLYPLLLSWLFKIFPATYLTMIFLNIVLFSASVSLVYVIGMGFLNEKGACVASVLYALYPTLWMISLYPATENLFIFLLLVSVYFFIRYVYDESLQWLFFSAFCFGLLTLTKEVGVFLPLLFAGILVARGMKRLPQAGKRAGVFLAAYMFCVLPLFGYHYQEKGRFALSKKMIRVMEYVRDRRHDDRQQLTAGGSGKHGIGVGEYVFRRRRFFLGTGTIGLMHAFGRNIDALENATASPHCFVRATFNYGSAWFMYHWWSIAYVAFMYLLSFCAMVKLLLERKAVIFCSIAAGILYFLTAYYYIFNARYFIQFIPLMGLLAVYCFQKSPARE
ncbi:MAG TPA: glycosyltransferase family 39 protein [Candidatus Omnitrophota bacterium]|nr:glycosyltransferase family 39 protein [Candidatus Omnitrophota bacterium]